MKKALILSAGLAAFITAAMAFANAAPTKTIGIVLPLDHVALRAMVDGFEESVSKNYPGTVHFEVENAEHDLNVQRSIIQKFINQKVDLIVPLATSTTQMTISMVSAQPVIGLAANFPASIRDQDNLSQRFTTVPDEIDSAGLIAFVHSVLPNAKKITLIYSAEDKVIQAVKEAEIAAKQTGITIQPLMINALPDLYAVSKRVDKDSQGIFILKDNLVASGINTLVYTANQKHIPLVTCDEGTVSGGAAVALGVEEKQIGISGGELAAKVLKGESMTQMPIEPVKTLEVFLNEPAAKTQGLDIDVVKSYAKQHGYTLILNPHMNV
jgi:putative tryptophan/tyrosine transport system substrate-binding protein